MDGLDVAYCNFEFTDQSLLSYKILYAETFPFPSDIQSTLKNILNLSVYDFCQADRNFGKWLGQQVNTFREKYKIEQLDFIGSHGHTILHQPKNGFTAQIGHGASLAAETKCTVVSDFRSLDVAMGGQGAPLVPIGDKLLFGGYDYCLNLGGISNISYERDGKMIAFDTSPQNVVFNKLAAQYDSKLEYDEDGKIAKEGKVNEDLRKKLLDYEFFKSNGPKSLGREHIEEDFMKRMDGTNISIQDKMRTCAEIFSSEIAKAVTESQTQKKGSKMLVTGGGALNKFFIELLSKKLEGICELVVPDKLTVNFKEALIFAFLGALRMKEQVNSLASVTGAKSDNVGGSVFLYKN